MAPHNLSEEFNSDRNLRMRHSTRWEVALDIRPLLTISPNSLAYKQHHSGRRQSCPPYRECRAMCEDNCNTQTMCNFHTYHRCYSVAHFVLPLHFLPMDCRNVQIVAPDCLGRAPIAHHILSVQCPTKRYVLLLIELALSNEHLQVQLQAEVVVSFYAPSAIITPKIDPPMAAQR